MKSGRILRLNRHSPSQSQPIPAHNFPILDSEVVRRAISHPHLATPAAVLHLQRHLGNAATRRLITRSNTVQRLILGANGEFDTGDADQYQDIVQHLETLDYDSLQYIYNLLDEDPDPSISERQLLLDITDLLQEADDIQAIDTTAHQNGGIWTMATLYYGNGHMWQSEIHGSQTEVGGYSYPEGLETADEDEQNLSARDSEVGVLDETMDYLNNNPPDHTAAYIKIVFTGNIGPCDGCKERLEQFKLDVEALVASLQLPHAVPVYVVSHYTTVNQTRQQGRGAHQHPTTYGYGDSQGKVSARGRAFWERYV